MTQPSAPKHRPFTDLLRDFLAQEGFGGSAAEALISLDAVNFQFVRRVAKGEVPATLIAEIAPEMEVALFYALSAIARIEAGRGRPAPEEPTVGTLAAEMMVDPSRASRIASDLVDRGLVARAVSQQDARRAVLVPTERGRALLDAFLLAKWRRMLRIFADWPEEEIRQFARLFDRYSEGMRREYPGAGGDHG